jgi:imidazolonepropionase-like amidohydrolase
MMRFLLFVLTFFSLFSGIAQINSPTNGVANSESQFIGLKNVTLAVPGGEMIENTDVLIEKGKIIKVGHTLKFPKGTIVHDLSGKYIFPSFIELNTDIGIKKDENRSRGHSFSPQLETEKLGPYYWNESIRPEMRAIDSYDFSNLKDENMLQKMGFGFTLPHVKDGVARGTAPFVAIGALPNEEKVLHEELMPFFSLHKGSSHQTYPSSQMGAIALLKQAFIDAQWYSSSEERSRNISMERLAEQMKKKVIFDASDKLEVLRIAKLIQEFDVQSIILCGGDEYQRIQEIKKAGQSYVLPLKFPDAFDVQSAYVAKEIPLSKLKHWELAPSNPFYFYQNEIPFALSANGIEKEADFWAAVRKAIQKGLPWEKAFESLTLYPAQLIGMDEVIGSVEKGKWASFNVYSANPFLDSDAKLMETWQLGRQTIHTTLFQNDCRGSYNIKLNTKLYTLIIKGEKEKPTAMIYPQPDYKPTASDTLGKECTLTYNDNDIVLQFNLDDETHKGAVLLNGRVYAKLSIMEGAGMLPNGEWLNWTGIKHAVHKPILKPKMPLRTDSLEESSLWFPHVAYGFDTLPAHNSYLIRNATIWTGEDEGVIQGGELLISNGKIQYVGKQGITAPKGVRVIDAFGKYVTAGIIDEHSHIGISKGVNESGQSVTAEVSIGDVINPDDINIYRQMAGGVTCSQLLHGSANAIGGQSAIIKLKWGYGASDLLLDNAPKFIKFALGENVKQANWGDYNTVRFPQTRMGVEQVYYDAFYRAKKYNESQLALQKKKKSTSTPIKRDLELEILAEILNGERHITCHSYIQSEINMLMQVADSMGFKINTFTHILEGYKLRDEMLRHGAGGSTFADWWAYKYEVIDAIPHNATLLNDKGVVAAINSDDAEMGRRLNQEAAKSVKYGGMTPYDAWKLVTLNPAKLLHLDNRMGSIKVGKDADIVIWSDEPLSVNAQVEKTFIDGILLYDSSKTEELNQRNAAERSRILSLMLHATKSGEKTIPYKISKQPRYHCDTEENSNHHGH